MRYLRYLVLILGLCFAAPYLRADQGNDHQHLISDRPSLTQQETIDIAVLVFPNVVLQDIAGPLEVFSKAKNLSDGKYRTFIVAESLDALETQNSALTISPDYTLQSMPEADYLLIPGASMSVINQLVEADAFEPFIDLWNENEETRIVSICTGAYLLADTGALDGRKATTHYFVADDFSEQFPEVELVRDVRFVDDGKYITSSGVTSGIDAALHIVDMHSGRKMRAMISRALQYRFHREDDWPIAPNGMKYERDD